MWKKWGGEILFFFFDWPMHTPEQRKIGDIEGQDSELSLRTIILGIRRKEMVWIGVLGKGRK